MEFIDLQRQYCALKKEIDEAIHSVLNKSDYILGEEVGLFESELAKYVGARHCVTCANGTDALSITLKALNISQTDAVFVPAFTFFATAEVVSLNNSACIFVDVDERTFNMSSESLERAIKLVKKEGKYNPKAVIAVDLFGQCADYDKIRKITNQYGLFLIEDGAQGFGGEIREKRACSFGDISTTSFFPAKPLGCYGDGGAIFTDDSDYAALLKSLRFHGKGADKYDNVRIGYNSRLDTIQAAILRVKLKAFKERELEKRQQIAAFYDKNLKGLVKTPFLQEGYKSSYAQYTIILKDGEQRNNLQDYLKKHGIPSMVYYPKSMHNQTVYKDYTLNRDELKVSQNLEQCVLSLPMHPYLTDEETQRIVDKIKESLC